MENPSASPRRGHVLEQRLLLTVAVLTVWIPSTTAEFTVETVPPIAIKGMNVLLLVHDMPEKPSVFTWFKGNTTDQDFTIASYLAITGGIFDGPANSSEYKAFINGSLLIQNITENNTGIYTLQVTVNSYIEHAFGQLHMYHPQIISNDSKPEEGKELVLTCEPDIPGMTYQWYKDDNELQEIPDRLQLSSNNRTLTLLNVTREDTGIYKCGIMNSETIAFTNAFILDVFYGPDSPTISPSEENYCSRTNLTLFCEADSNPPAQYTWLINGKIWGSTQQLHIPSISTSDSGSYTCEVHNSNTGLNNTAVRNITVYGAVIQASSTAITEKDSLVLTCITAEPGLSIQWIFNSQSLQLTERMNLSSDNSILTIEPVMMEDEGEYQCEVFYLNCSSRSDPVRITVKAIDTENTHLLPGAIAGIVIGAFVALILLCILAYFLYCSKTRRSRPV